MRLKPELLKHKNSRRNYAKGVTNKVIVKALDAVVSGKIGAALEFILPLRIESQVGIS